MVDEDYSVRGLNCSLEEARKAAEWCVIIDVARGIELGPRAEDDIQIKEFVSSADPEDSTELPASLIVKD